MSAPANVPRVVTGSKEALKLYRRFVMLSVDELVNDLADATTRAEVERLRKDLALWDAHVVWVDSEISARTAS